MIHKLHIIMENEGGNAEPVFATLDVDQARAAYLKAIQDADRTCEASDTTPIINVHTDEYGIVHGTITEHGVEEDVIEVEDQWYSLKDSYDDTVAQWVGVDLEMPEPVILTGKALAKRYAETHPLSEENPGKVYGYYNHTYGWVEIHGNELKPHPDLSEQHPNGWSLFDHVRPDVAQAVIANNHAELRKLYAECGSFVTKPADPPSKT